LFKSILFICAGYIIHGLLDNQDIRSIGRICQQKPLLIICLLVSNLSLCGVPFLAGYYSKDLILENLFIKNLNVFVYFLFVISVLFTVMYTFRLIYYRMIREFKIFGYHNLRDKNSLILLRMLTILIIIVFKGSLIIWMIMLREKIVFLSFLIKIMILVVCLVGIIIGILISLNNFIYNNVLLFLKNFLGEIWFLIYLSTCLINWFFLKMGYNFYKNIDLGWREKIGGIEFFYLLSKISKFRWNFQGESYLTYQYIYIYMSIWLLYIICYL